MIVCSNCGSSNIEEKWWVNPNTKDLGERSVFDDNDLYCNDCNQHFPHITEEEFKKETIRQQKSEGNVN